MGAIVYRCVRLCSVKVNWALSSLPLIKAPGMGKDCLLQQHDILFDRLVYKIHIKQEARR